MKKYASIEKPWLRYFTAEQIARPLPECIMYQHLKKNRADSLGLTAISYYGTTVTYGQMFDQIEIYADHFATLGVKKGDYVTFLTVSTPETVYAIYALNKIGAVCNFIDVRTDAPHIVEFTKKAKSDLIIVIDAVYDKVKDRFDEMGVSKVILQSAFESLSFTKRLALKLAGKMKAIPITDSRIITNKDFLRMAVTVKAEEVEYKRNQPAIVTRTGGTTGKSKGVQLTNYNMNAVDANCGDSFLDGVMEGNSLLNFLPLAASYGIAVGIHVAFCRGAVNILMPKFVPDDFALLVDKYKPNYIIGVPVFYEKLITDDRVKNMDLSYIKAMISGGDSANEALEEQLYDFILKHGGKYPLAQGYGMSEGSSVVSFAALDVHKNGASGVPCIHNVIAAFKPGTYEEMPLGEAGELCISGPTVMQEYLDEPEETAGILHTHPDGKIWIHSGDIGMIDEDGFLHILGRIKHSVIRFDGHKVYPLQLEEIVARMDNVKNVCVIGVQDLDHEQGHLPLILIEPVDYAAADKEAMAKEALELCLENIELRSQPAGAVIVESIPVTPNLKNDVMKLTKQYEHYNYR